MCFSFAKQVLGLFEHLDEKEWQSMILNLSLKNVDIDVVELFWIVSLKHYSPRVLLVGLRLNTVFLSYENNFSTKMTMGQSKWNCTPYGSWHQRFFSFLHQ